MSRQVADLLWEMLAKAGDALIPVLDAVRRNLGYPDDET